MIDKKFYFELPNLLGSYLNSLKKNNDFKYYPAGKGLTSSGEEIELGFSNYALKIHYMIGTKGLDTVEWSDYLNSYQLKNTQFKENSFVDKALISHYKNLGFNEELKFIIKKYSNYFLNSKYKLKNIELKNAINADTKQSISTLYQIGSKNKYKLGNEFKDFNECKVYLDSLDWTKPWSAGAQFSSLCVYAETQDYPYKENLIHYATQLLNQETGSYFKNKPNDNREIINGAMKIITGLDWIGYEVHKPKKLIDFCLNNKPYLEGCDIVDFVYVLYKCSSITNYKKKEINNLFIGFLDNINSLFKKDEGGYSYFKDRSQTHYYGVKISKGFDVADLHGTLLCSWAIFMILKNLEMLDDNIKIIKP